MRVLMTTKAGAGHFGPLIPFARAFQRAGADVLVAAPREAAADGAGRAPAAVGLRRPARARSAPRSSPRCATSPPTPASTGASRATSSRASTRAPPSPASSPPAGPGGPTSSSARSRSSPARWRPRSSAFPPSCVGISQQGKEERVTSRRRRRGRRAARRASAWRPTPAASACCGRPYFTLMPAALEDPATPARAARSASASRAPPFAATRSTAGPADGRPLVYVTFGSAAPSMDFFPGLYRAAIDALAGLPRAPAGDRRARPRPGRRWGRVPANVRVERWVPQADLMPHVAAMVCHGGSGTVTMGLAAGVPMAVLPLFADQPWNAERVRRAGRGDRARRRPRGGRRAARGGRRGSPAIPATAPAPSGSPPRCARCRRSTPRSASCAGC